MSLPAPSTPQPLIELHNIIKVFKSPAGDYSALKGVDLSFLPGEFTAIMGKSGSGKSTLINMITGIDHPTKGVVRVDGMEIHRMSESQMAAWRGRTLGIVFQFFQLLPMLSILENTMLPMDFCNLYARAEREERALEVLRRVGLEDVADKLPAALSGGQQQIAAIARSLANDPPIIVADEPTGNLDSRTAAHILDIFDDLASRGKTILIVTHDSGLARRSRRRVLISDGELINENVGKALPGLPHPILLKITKLAVPRAFEPGAVLARQGALDAGLYVITRGRVEALRQGRRGGEEVICTLEAGQYFSEIELVENPIGNLVFRAASPGPVEALCLSLGNFNQILAESPAAAAALRQAAREHCSQQAPARPSGDPLQAKNPPERKPWAFLRRR
jgi:ABC-type lipoprotein export system ATPase subunit